MLLACCPLQYLHDHFRLATVQLFAKFPGLVFDVKYDLRRIGSREWTTRRAHLLRKWSGFSRVWIMHQ